MYWAKPDTETADCRKTIAVGERCIRAEVKNVRSGDCIEVRMPVSSEM